MSRRTVLRIAAGLLLLGVAAAVALVAEDARRWPDRLERGDVAYRSSALGVVDPWRPTDRLPLRLGDEAAGVADDLDYRRALHDIRRIRSTVNIGPTNAAFVRRLGEAQTLLVRIEDDDPSPRRRSAAANLLGYLYFVSSQGSGAGSQFQFVRAALDAFRRAILVDPDNDDAKFNLELVMRRLEAQGKRVPATQFGAAEDRGQGGATLSPRGSGY